MTRWSKLVCAAGKVTNASYIVSPRDSASGMATGKRQYAPVKIRQGVGRRLAPAEQDETSV